MRVLVCHNRYRSSFPSGENRIVDDEIALLRDAGIDVVPMIEESDSLTSGGPLRMANAALGPLYSPTGVRRFRTLLRDIHPDVVHLHNVFPLISPAVVRVAKACGMPIVQTVHNYRHTCVNGLHFRDGHQCYDCIGRRLANPAILHRCYRGSRSQSAAMVLGQAAHRGTWRMVDNFIARTPFMARQLLAVGLDERQITVLPSWVPDPGEPKAPGEDFLYLGRLEEAKGVNLLLEAWSLRKNRSRQRLRVAGTGPLEDRVRSIALTGDRVDYVGQLDRREAAAAIEHCGVVVVPSLWDEGYPLAVVEALAHGRPVVVNHGTSVASAVSDEFSWRIKPTVGSWREAIDMIKRDDIEARGLAARRRYVEACSPRIALELLVQVYEGVLRATAPGGRGSTLGDWNPR
jgi:glycosyltransferase involved in cell wall biosynthesis